MSESEWNTLSQGSHSSEAVDKCSRCGMRKRETMIPCGAGATIPYLETPIRSMPLRDGDDLLSASDDLEVLEARLPLSLPQYLRLLPANLLARIFYISTVLRYFITGIVLNFRAYISRCRILIHNFRTTIEITPARPICIAIFTCAITDINKFYSTSRWHTVTLRLLPRHYSLPGFETFPSPTIGRDS